MKIATAGIVAALVAFPSMGAAFAPSVRTNVVWIVLGVKKGSDMDSFGDELDRTDNHNGVLTCESLLESIEAITGRRIVVFVGTLVHEEFPNCFGHGGKCRKKTFVLDRDTSKS
jgi:hypothetical protein